jgi:hypothetical protein
MAGDLEQAPRYPNLRAHPFNYPSRPSRSPLSVGELSSLGALNHPRKRQESLFALRLAERWARAAPIPRNAAPVSAIAAQRFPTGSDAGGHAPRTTTAPPVVARCTPAALAASAPTHVGVVVARLAPLADPRHRPVAATRRARNSGAIPVLCATPNASPARTVPSEPAVPTSSAKTTASAISSVTAPSNQATLPSAPAAATPPPSFRKSPGQRAGHRPGRGSRPRDDATLRPRPYTRPYTRAPKCHQGLDKINLTKHKRRSSRPI